MTIKINNIQDFTENINNKNLVVIKFSANWCRPCKQIMPFYHYLEKKYDQVIFCEINIEMCEDICNICNITTIPTFCFFRDGTFLRKECSANEKNLENAIIELCAQ